eukprot:CAMPEP_0169425104 /NCGR_PEP_ID=MMETSP1017-20121227/68389_1 /TAXON_ID=342587 /ORGANISM="Karlodinium micrum, Strain CCMP2283" /LENGTH=166 /DNA_ID=CAMNT_0009534919 /DNA_START=239 /DNA_END=736 /DNA_ORIENTATION=-
MYGAVKRTETAVRFYLASLVASVMLFISLVWRDPCTSTGQLLQMLAEDLGAAAMCGYLRVTCYGFFVFVTCSEAYGIFIVWSYCQDLYDGINGPGIHELIVSKDDAFRLSQLRKSVGMGNDIVGVPHSKLSGGPYPSPYGAATLTSGWPSHSLFGGSDHELNYPPK